MVCSEGHQRQGTQGKVGAEPYICVNMGSGTAEEAMHWVEFCNGTGNSKYVQMRRELGYDEPFSVK